jgi:hypothetical protein|tara:strand:- start:233 stop:529 length:297 start_codon:yes stop_codon:yes gene_type:complete
MASYFNITGVLTQELLAVGDNYSVSSIQLVNTHATDSVTIDVFIEKQLTGTFYLLKKVELPIGVTLVYDSKKFSNRVGEFGLYIKLSAADSVVDVIIN